MADTVLLTGATGFLGSRLLAALLERGHKVAILKRSTSNLARLHDLSPTAVYDLDVHGLEQPFKDLDIGMVIHCAAAQGRKGETQADMLRANVLFPLELLQAARDHGARTFINAGTNLPAGLSTYALTKAQFVQWLGLAAAPMQAVTLRQEHLYGPGDDAGKFVVWLLDKFQGDVVPLTAGTQQRGFLFVDDAVQAFLTVLDAREALPQVCAMNLGTGADMPVRAFVEALRDAHDRLAPQPSRARLDFGCLDYRPDEPMVLVTDSPELKALGWSPRTSLQDGLERTVRWYLESLKKSRD